MQKIQNAKRLRTLIYKLIQKRKAEIKIFLCFWV